MNQSIENLYFDWLCAKVRTQNPRQYLELFRILHSYAFVDVSGLDENRVEDAKELREYFLVDANITGNHFWLTEDCSVFEMLIAFSERAAFQIEMPAKTWFWQFLTNLQLNDYRHVTNSDLQNIDFILHRFVSRTYNDNGDGGLFPLRRPKRDQRYVEIWYQFCDYVEDNGLLYGLV